MAGSNCNGFPAALGINCFIKIILPADFFSRFVYYQLAATRGFLKYNSVSSITTITTTITTAFAANGAGQIIHTLTNSIVYF